MKLDIVGNVPWFNSHLDKKSVDEGADITLSTTGIVEVPKQRARFDFKLWGCALLSILPWKLTGKDDHITGPATINKNLRRHAQRGGLVRNQADRPAALRFRPYVCKVPWHTGPRAFLSQLFPRYGHYCGPNWSSGKDGGSLLWDKRPIDWLDYCCYCHDMGYDTHDQAKLLEADLAFLNCLERPNMPTKGDAHIARIYKTMCVTGLKNLLIPYRMHLVKLQSTQPLFQFGWLSNIKWKSWNWQKS